MISIFFLILNLLFAFAIFFLTIAFITGAPFVPSTTQVSQKMILLANIKPGMKVYDLGSGDGRLLLLAAAKKAQATGFEINPFLVIVTLIKKIISPDNKLIKIIWRNFWTANIRDADVVFVYLLPWRMEKLAHKLKTECKPGTQIISNSFIFPKWKIMDEDKQLHVYRFVI
jgi:hypothetical protein